MKTQLPDNAGSNVAGEALLAVGLWFKEARELKGESLEDVSKITRIGKTYLEAIEQGAVTKLPSQAYTRGFIRLYASHLGLSSDEALRMLIGQVQEVSQNSLPETQSPVSSPLPAKQQATGSGKTRTLLFVLVITASLAVMVFTIINRIGPTGSLPAEQTKTTMQPPAETAPALPATAPPPPAAIPPASATLPNNAEKVLPREGIVLRLKAVSSGRLHITIDGSVSQEYDLVAGDLVEWKAEKMFLLDLENAGSVEGELDGKRLAPFGEAGQKAHLSIGQSGVQQN